MRKIILLAILLAIPLASPTLAAEESTPNWRCVSLTVAVDSESRTATATWEINRLPGEEADLDWGDGSPPEIIATGQTTGHHTYADGTYLIQVRVWNPAGDAFRACKVQIKIQGPTGVTLVGLSASSPTPPPPWAGTMVLTALVLTTVLVLLVARRRVTKKVLT